MGICLPSLEFCPTQLFNALTDESPFGEMPRPCAFPPHQEEFLEANVVGFEAAKCNGTRTVFLATLYARFYRKWPDSYLTNAKERTKYEEVSFHCG